MWEGQFGGANAAGAGIDFHGGANTELAQGPGDAERASRPRRGDATAPRETSLRRTQAREYQAKVPGDIVQVDTLDVRPIPGVILKGFTARDVVSRCDVLEAHTRATARPAGQFLGSLRGRKPFPVRAIRVDGGSEFQAGFESACQGPGIKLFVLPPRCPKRNGHVERAQHTHTEEFYHLYKGDLAITSLNQALLAWEGVYNTVRCPGSFDCPLMSLRAHRGNLEAVSTNAVASSLLAATIR